MKIKKTARLAFRCTPDWIEQVKQRAQERGEDLTEYITTCIALGECVLDGTFREEDEGE